MRLISCHIDNFGCLSNFDCVFDGKKTVISKENGWGKSTFAAFLRVMFYGLSGGRKHSFENDRAHYLPWQGGVFGGNLTFSVNGKKYLLTRHFKERDSADFFELRDAETNLPSDDFSENLGVEIFGIDAESFMRTAFMGQDDMTVSVTSGINAKIGNLNEDSGDMNRFTDAMDRIKNELNALSKSRKTGRLYQIQEEIARLDREERSNRGIDREIELVAGKSKEVSERMAETEDRIRENRLLEKRANDQERLQSAFSMLQNLKNDLTQKQDLLKTAERPFPKGVPEKNELEDAYRFADALKSETEAVERTKLSEAEENRLAGSAAGLFEELPEEGAFRIKIRELQSEFSKRESYLRNIEKAEEKETDAENRMKAESKKAVLLQLLLVPALCLIAGSVAIFAFLPDLLTAGAAAGGIGLVLLILAIVFSAKHKKNARLAAEDTARIINGKDAVCAELSAVDRNAEAFLERFGLAYEPASFYSDCAYLCDELAACRALTIRKKAVSEALEKASGYRKKLDAFCTEYGLELIGDPELAIHDLLEKRAKYANAKENLSDAEENLSEFAKGQDMERLEFFVPADNLPNVSEIREGTATLESRLEELKQEAESYERELEGLRERYEEWEKAGAALAEKREEEELLSRRTAIFEKTQAALRTANETLTARYAAPVLNAFKEYYGMVETNDPSELRIDARSVLTVMAFGEQREVGAFSKGSQDFLGLCYRFALIHAMYPDEKPFVILDDPFTNLDETRLDSAKRLLDRLSDEYQMIYFTCHNSRE